MSDGYPPPASAAEIAAFEEEVRETSLSEPMPCTGAWPCDDKYCEPCGRPLCNEDTHYWPTMPKGQTPAVGAPCRCGAKTWPDKPCLAISLDGKNDCDRTAGHDGLLHRDSMDGTLWITGDTE